MDPMEKSPARGRAVRLVLRLLSNTPDSPERRERFRIIALDVGRIARQGSADELRQILEGLASATALWGERGVIADPWLDCYLSTLATVVAAAEQEARAL